MNAWMSKDKKSAAVLGFRIGSPLAKVNFKRIAKKPPKVHNLTRMKFADKKK